MTGVQTSALPICGSAPNIPQGSSPESDGPADLHQAFVTLGNLKEFPVSAKVGRQELSYGDERLIGAFGWHNIGRVFDGAKLRCQNEWFGVDGFATRLVVPDDNNFNMASDYEWFSGLYFNTAKIPLTLAEFYLLARNVSPEAASLYHDRSPVHFADRISCPVILLQGLEDTEQFFQPDRIHPNQRAQSIMLDNVLPTLKPMLK